MSTIKRRLTQWDYAKSLAREYEGVPQEEIDRACGPWERYWASRHAGNTDGILLASVSQAAAFRDGRRGDPKNTSATLATLERVYRIGQLLIAGECDSRGSTRIRGVGVLANPFTERALPRPNAAGKPRKPRPRVTSDLIGEVLDMTLDDGSDAACRDFLLIATLYLNDVELTLDELTRWTVAMLRRKGWLLPPKVDSFLTDLGLPNSSPAFPKTTSAGDLACVNGLAVPASVRSLYRALRNRGQNAGLATLTPQLIREARGGALHKRRGLTIPQ